MPRQYEHYFSAGQLSVILDGYLGLAPYFTALSTSISIFLQQYQQLPEQHNRDHSHPLKISRNGISGQQEWLYPLGLILRLLDSQEYYEQLPKGIIVNQLYTHTNIAIIQEALSIVSQEMSKKIKTTISGKSLSSKQPLQCKEEQKEGAPRISIAPIRANSSIMILTEKLLDTEDGKAPRKRIIRTHIAGTKHCIDIDRSIAQEECWACQSYLIYLAESTGNSFDKDQLDRIPKQVVRTLKVIADAVTHFTLYLKDHNMTSVPNHIHTLNKVLNGIGLVITEDILTSKLNPKRNPNTCFADNSFSIQQLFRMIIYCPTTEEVAAQLKTKKQTNFNSSTSNEKKSYHDENQRCKLQAFERERKDIMVNTVNIRPVYKQLEFELDDIELPTQVPNQYNVFHPSQVRHRKKRSSSSQKVSHKKHPTPKNVLANVELTKSVGRLDQTDSNKIKKRGRLDLKDKIKDDTKNQKPKNKTTQGFGHTRTHKLSDTRKAFLRPESSKSQTLFNNFFSQFIPDSKSESKRQSFNFKEVLLQSLAINTPSQDTVRESIDKPPKSVTALNNKSNAFSSTFEAFIGEQKKEEEQLCIEKQERDEYERSLLNGRQVRDEVYHELRRNKAVIHNSYKEASVAVGENQEMHISYPSNDDYVRSQMFGTESLIEAKHSTRPNNIIDENRVKFNDAGMIRNEKFCRNFKKELLNYRDENLCNTQDNQARHRLAAKLKKQKSIETQKKTYREMYTEQLRKLNDHS